MRPIDDVTDEISDLRGQIGALLVLHENAIEEFLVHPDRTERVPNALEVIAAQVSLSLSLDYEPKIPSTRDRCESAYWMNLSGITAIVGAFLEEAAGRAE